MVRTYGLGLVWDWFTGSLEVALHREAQRGRPRSTLLARNSYFFFGYGTDTVIFFLTHVTDSYFGNFLPV